MALLGATGLLHGIPPLRRKRGAGDPPLQSRRTALTFFCFLFALLCLGPLPATAVSVAMTGTISGPGSFPFPPNPELQGITRGDAIEVTLTFDPVTQVGSIFAAVPARQVTFHAGPILTLYIEREIPSGRADFGAEGEVPKTSRSLILTVLDPTGLAFAAPTLPTSAEAFLGLRFGLSYDTTRSGIDPPPTIPLFTASGTVTSIPEPSLAILLGLTLGLRRRLPSRDSVSNAGASMASHPR